MPAHTSTRIRLGALALGLSALLFTAFPLVRPFFRLDPRSPDETLAAASPLITSGPWVLAHLMVTLAFVLLLYGMLALYARLAAVPRGPSPILGLVLSLAGIALIMPMLGVETFILPIVGLMFLFRWIHLFRARHLAQRSSPARGRSAPGHRPRPVVSTVPGVDPHRRRIRNWCGWCLAGLGHVARDRAGHPGLGEPPGGLSRRCARAPPGRRTRSSAA